MTNPEKLAELAERLWAKVDKSGDCWVWTAYRRPSGYGQIGIKAGRVRDVHRVAYELVKGPIPVGMQLDHLCRNRACCNPDHLEPVTSAENTRRGNAGLHHRKWAESLTHCLRGHEYSEENTYVSKRGKRNCRICRNTLQNERRRVARSS